MLDLKNVAIVETGVRDGLGDRLTGFDRVAGQTLQILRVRPELAAFGATLDEVVARFTERSDRHVLNARGVVRDDPTARPLVVFEHIEGERFDDILARAHALSVVPDITVALFLANHLLTALAALGRTTQAAHGALSLNRILVTPRGRIVITEHVFGPLLEQLEFSHARLWHELHVAMPEEPIPALCDYRADVAQVAVITLSLILGRPLEENEYPDRLEDLLAEVREVAWIRAGDVLANAVGSWLDLALPLPGRLIFDEASQAKEALGSMLPADQNFVGSRADLHAFLKQIAEAESSGEAELTERPDTPPPFEVVTASGETILVAPADGQDEESDGLDDTEDEEVVEAELQTASDGGDGADLVVEFAEAQEDQEEEEPVIELSTDLLDELKTFGIVLPSAQAVETPAEPAPADEGPSSSGTDTAASETFPAPAESPEIAALESATVAPTTAESPVALDEPSPTEATAVEAVTAVGPLPQRDVADVEPPAEVPAEVAEAPAPEVMAVEPIAAAPESVRVEAPAAELIAPTEPSVIAVGREAWFDLDTPVEAPVDEAAPVAGLAADASVSIEAWKVERPEAPPAVVVETSEGWFDLDSPIEAPVGPPLPLVAELPATEEPRFERDSVAEKAAREKVAAETLAAAAPAVAQPSDESPAADEVPETPSIALAESASTPEEKVAEPSVAEAPLEELPTAEPAPLMAREGIDVQEAIAVPTEAPAPDAGPGAGAPVAEPAFKHELPAVEPAAAEAPVEPVEPEFELFARPDESHPHANLDAWFELEPPLPAPDETSLFDAYAPPHEPAVPASTERLPGIDFASDVPVVDTFEPTLPSQAEPSPSSEALEATPAESAIGEPVEATRPTPPLVESFEAPASVAPDTQATEVAPEPVLLDAAGQRPEPARESPPAQDLSSAELEAELEPKTGAFASFLADVKALISKIKGPEGEEAEPVDSERIEWEERVPRGERGDVGPRPAEANEVAARWAETAPEPGSEPAPSRAAASIEEAVVEIAPDTEPAAAEIPAFDEPSAPLVDDVIAAVDEAVAAAGPSAEQAPAATVHDPLADVVASLEDVVARTAAPASQPPPPGRPSQPEAPVIPVRQDAPAVAEPVVARELPARPPQAPAEPEPAVATAPEKKRSRRSRHRKRKKAGPRPDAAPATLPASTPPTPPTVAVAPPVSAPMPTVPVRPAATAPAAPAASAMAGPAIPEPAPTPPPPAARPAAAAPAARSSLISDPEAATMRQWMVSGDDAPVVPAPQQKSLNITTPGTAPPPRQSLISDADVTIIRDWTAIEGDDQASSTPVQRPFGAQPAGMSAPPTLRPIAPPAPTAPTPVSAPALPTVPIRPDLNAERSAAAQARDTAEEVALKARVRALIDSERKTAEPEPGEPPPLSMGSPRLERPSRWTWMRIAAALVVLVGGAVAAGSQLLGSRTRSGTVTVESTPPESEVFLDGTRSGQTPVTLKVSPGEHALEVRYDGHRQALTLSVASGDEIIQSFDWATLTPIGALEVSSDPAGARVLIDGKVAGETPLKVDGLSLGEHSVTVENGSGSVTSPVRITEDEIAKLDVPIFSGWLAVFAPVELQIFEKGRLLGTTANSRIMVRPGVHHLELKNEAFNYRALETVAVKPGEVKALSYEPKGRVNLNAEPWAEVSVDGKRVGETPLANVLVTIGTREFVFRHPQLGERRVTAVVTAGRTKLVNVDMNSR